MGYEILKLEITVRLSRHNSDQDRRDDALLRALKSELRDTIGEYPDIVIDTFGLEADDD
jgi:hypothetical protein